MGKEFDGAGEVAASKADLKHRAKDRTLAHWSCG